jgi:NAD(P)-dependent dehydrogenase (short-subunit alcohol dehydrogenase family)
MWVWVTYKYVVMYLNAKSTTCFITGHTTGLGKAIYEHMLAKGYQVNGFSRSNGYNLETDFEKICTMVKGADIFVNNAYADGAQLDYLRRLRTDVKKMIICGSVSGFDTRDGKYSADKAALINEVNNSAGVKNTGIADMLLLNLSSSAYTDHSAIVKLLDYWLENPTLLQATFDIR